MSNIEQEQSNSEQGLVSFGEERALVRFTHKRTETEEGAVSRRQYTQWRLSTQLGKEVPLEEIVVKPDVGEEYELETSFVVKPDGELYIGLQSIHEESPTVLPTLIDNLNQFIDENVLDEGELGLVNRAIGQIKQIIEQPK